MIFNSSPNDSPWGYLHSYIDESPGMAFMTPGIAHQWPFLFSMTEKRQPRQLLISGVILEWLKTVSAPRVSQGA